MKQVVGKVLGIILLGCCLYACGKYTGDKHRKTAEGFDESVTELQEEWVLYRSKDFSIQFPPIFRLDTSGYNRSSLILYTELTDDGDLYLDKISILVKDREDKLSLEAYGKQCEANIMQYTESPEVLNSDIRSKNGRKYYELIYSESQSEYRIIHEQHIMFSGNKMYSITLSCEDAAFDQCKEVGETIMSTFTFN